MNPKEDFSVPETQGQNKKDKPAIQESFDPIEQKIEWCIALITKDYKAKFWTDLPAEIKNVLPELFTWKSENERDEICDSLIDIIQHWDEVELYEYLELKTWKKIETSNEQVEIVTKENKIERNENKINRNNSIIQLANSLENLNWEWKNYNSTLNRIKNLKALVAEKGLTADFDAEVKSILAELENPEILFSLSLDLQQKDPKAYESFKSSVIELQPSFEAKFIALEPKLKMALGTDTLKNATISGNRITQTSPDGYTTTAALDGSERTLGRSDSPYRLKSRLASDKQLQTEADRAEKELNNRIEPIIKQLQSLEAVKKYLEKASLENTELAEVKAEIKSFSPELYAELWLENLSTIADIQRAVEARNHKLTKERDRLEARTRDYLDILSRRQHFELAEKQEVQKQVLDFLHGIWFDAIPQTATDTIISSINATPQKYGLAQKIDFENGSLWFDADFWGRAINEQEKQKFIELFNRMVTWSSQYPVKLAGGIIMFYETPENAEANIPASYTFSIGAFVNGHLWAEPVFKAMMNLENKEDEPNHN